MQDTVIRIDNDLPSIRAILEHYGASLRQTHGTGKPQSVLSIQTHTSQAVQILIRISSFVLLVVYKETVFKLLSDRKD